MFDCTKDEFIEEGSDLNLNINESGKHGETRIVYKKSIHFMIDSSRVCQFRTDLKKATIISI